MLNIFLFLSGLSSEQERITSLYKKYKSTIYNYAYNILKNRQDAEDVVNDTFVTMMLRFERIKDRDEKSARNYLIIIAKNKALSKYNERKKIVSYEENIVDEDMTGDVERQIDLRMEHSKVLQNIKELDEKYADVLMLKYYYGMTANEIASELGLTPENVKIRLVRARRMLKEKLEKEEQYDECGI